jgi:alkanesulfonate monooxygenase SsuD/methylene tetrahydromethanopterin reductase-like flavin-dependent oxidoreductase (luciferase family)
MGRSRPPLTDAPIAPRAYQHVLPVWVGVGGTPTSAERAGRLGLPMVLGYIGGPLARARQTVDFYRQAGERAGHPEKLRVGISTHFYAGENAAAAREVFPYYHEYLRPKTPGGRGFVVDRTSFEAGTRPGQALMIGSSDELIAKILDADRVLGGLDRFYGRSTGADFLVRWWRHPSPAWLPRSRRRFARPWRPEGTARLNQAVRFLEPVS